MRFSALLAVAAMTSPAIAQMPVLRPGGSGSIVFRRGADVPRIGIGVTTTSGVAGRDTLGVLVTAVRPGSPAEKAGIEEGNRIASINGVSLKLAAADVGEFEVSNVMSRRLTRELEKVKAGDDVTLQVYANGQTRTVKVKAVAPEDLRPTEVRRSADDRATLGISIGLTGSKRDSLGVFVMSVEDNGPAAKAGIEEGSRITSINGVDLRRKDGADEEPILRASNVTRLERELAKVKPGDDVDLRVYFNGQSRNVKVKTVRMSDLPRQGRTFTIMGSDNFVMPPMPPIPPMPRVEINPDQIRSEMRRSIEGARGVMMSFGNRVIW